MRRRSAASESNQLSDPRACMLHSRPGTAAEGAALQWADACKRPDADRSPDNATTNPRVVALWPLTTITIAAGSQVAIRDLVATAVGSPSVKLRSTRTRERSTGRRSTPCCDGKVIAWGACNIDTSHTVGVHSRPCCRSPPVFVEDGTNCT